ncbi:paeninodin family lasso peptide [Metabacillus litoralis]|nr:paeninodin family lasso peptide [Metabacillus litoralis]
MKKEWTKPTMEILDFSETMKFWPPRDPDPDNPGEPGEEPGSGLES